MNDLKFISGLVSYFRSFATGLIFGSCIVIAGCQSEPTQKDLTGKMDKVLQESAASNKGQKSIPKNISKALIPSMNLGAAEVPAAKDEQRFDISVNNVPADQFFLSLVEGTSYNMVVHPEVTGTITLNLQNVTIPEVMEAVRDVYGYEFMSTPYGFQVLPGRLRARIYQINYLNVERTGSSKTFVSSGSLTQSKGSNTSNDANQNTTTSPNRTTTVIGTEISTKQPETGFWDELKTSVQAIVGTGDGRSVVVNPQSGVVVVRALPNELREVEAFLTATQLIVQRQVILEAKIIEVKLNDKFQTGINWAAMLTPDGHQVTLGQIGGGSVLTNDGGVSDIAGTNFTLDPSQFPFGGTASSAFGGVFALALKLGDFTSFIELLKTQGNVQVLSSPRVATINNQKAVIKVGTDEFFVTDVTNTTVTGTATTVSPSVTLTPFFSGIALDVTPQISEDGMVTLHVHPSVSEVTDQEKTVTIGSITQQLPLALSTVRESDSIVRARSGQVVVIGGLMQDLVTKRNAATPGFGDVPLLGNLFKHQNNESEKSELVILLKPIVVNDEQEWNQAITETSENIRRLKDK